MNISIIRTGTANLASVTAAFTRLNCKSRIVETPSELDAQDAVVLPGVGAFGAGMKSLRENGWDELLAKRFENNEPTLAICLGLQMLCRSSEESPGVRGLGVLPTDVKRLPANVSVPHFGWNRIESLDGWFKSGFVYYANSFCVAPDDAIRDADWDVALTSHGIPFVAAVKKGSLLACQFHPELSGSFGQRLLSTWLENVPPATANASTTSREEESSC